MAPVHALKLPDVSSVVKEPLNSLLGFLNSKISALTAPIFYTFKFLRPFVYHGSDVLTLLDNVQDLYTSFTSVRQIAPWGFSPIIQDLFKQVTKSVVGVTALALQILGHPMGQPLMTLHKFISSGFSLLQNLRDRQYSPAFTKALQTLAQILYLAVNFYGGNWLKLSALIVEFISYIAPLKTNFERALGLSYKISQERQTLIRQFQHYTKLADTFNGLAALQAGTALSGPSQETCQTLNSGLKQLFQALSLDWPQQVPPCQPFVLYLQAIRDLFNIALEKLNQKTTQLNELVSQNTLSLGRDYGSSLGCLLSMTDLLLQVADLTSEGSPLRILR